MTDYYVRVIDDGMSMMEEFWAVEKDVAHQGIVPSKLGTHHADPGEDIMITLQKRGFPPEHFHKMLLGPGKYFPRMARPSSTRPKCSPGRNPDQSTAARNIRTTSTGQLHALIQELQKICRVVHPIEHNFSAYGHQIRNIIVMACTEVEAQWKNILVANGQKADNRVDYIKLSLPMKLREYRVGLPWYPWLDPIAPFENWVPPRCGEKQRLPWYDAYNAVKHDREKNFCEAKLIHALESVTGCFVMLCAQYGWDLARRAEAAADAFFLIDIDAAPKWRPSEIYVPPYGETPQAQPYPFGSSG
jgi:hypothetical protein